MTEFSKIIGPIGPQTSVNTSYMPADMVTKCIFSKFIFVISITYPNCFYLFFFKFNF